MLRTTALKTKWEPVFISFFYKYVWVLIASKWAHRTQEERGTGCLVPLLPVFSVLPPQVMPHNIRQKQPTLGALYPRVGLICPGEFWCLHSNKDRLSFLLSKEHNEWGTGREWGRVCPSFPGVSGMRKLLFWPVDLEQHTQPLPDAFILHLHAAFSTLNF